MKKNIVYLIAFIILGLTSCNKDSDEPDTSLILPELYDQWEWVYSFGGIAGDTVTPASMGFSVTLEYTSEGIVNLYRDYSLEITDNFSLLEIQGNDDFDYMIEYGNSAIYPDQYVSFPHVDTLFLLDNALDGYESIYYRK